METKNLEFYIKTIENRVIVVYTAKKKIDVNAFKQAVGENLSELECAYNSIVNPLCVIMFEDVEEIVAKYTGIDPEAMKVKSRKREIVTARQIAQAMGKEYTRCSLATVGAYFGGKNHATVLNSIGIVRDTLPLDKKYGYASIVKAVIEDMEKLKAHRLENKRRRDKRDEQVQK